MPVNQSDPQFKLRLPAALKKELEVIARRSNRTLSAEIISRLEVSLDMQADPELGSLIRDRVQAENDRESIRNIVADLKAERQALIDATNDLTNEALKLARANQPK